MPSQSGMRDCIHRGASLFAPNPAYRSSVPEERTVSFGLRYSARIAQSTHPYRFPSGSVPACACRQSDHMTCKRPSTNPISTNTDKYTVCIITLPSPECNRHFRKIRTEYRCFFRDSQQFNGETQHWMPKCCLFLWVRCAITHLVPK